eukprot:2927127-Rhodomonas_salina.3
MARTSEERLACCDSDVGSGAGCARLTAVASYLVAQVHFDLGWDPLVPGLSTLGLATSASTDLANDPTNARTDLGV